MVARFEIASPEIMSFSNVDGITTIISPNPIMIACIISLSPMSNPPKKSHKFSRRVRRLQQSPRPLQVLKHCPHNCRQLDSGLSVNLLRKLFYLDESCGLPVAPQSWVCQGVLMEDHVVTQNVIFSLIVCKCLICEPGA